jgi:hypothetical protein
VHRRPMGHLSVEQRDAEALYEITVQGPPPIGLTARFPSVTLSRAPTATILCRQVTGFAEIDALMERLRSIGVAPIEVHASPGHDPSSPQEGEPANRTGDDDSSRAGSWSSRDYYEFRIQGRLGDSILNYLQWPSRLEHERTLVRVVATQAEVQAILGALADSGAQIDHFIRRPAS